MARSVPRAYRPVGNRAWRSTNRSAMCRSRVQVPMDSGSPRPVFDDAVHAFTHDLYRQARVNQSAVNFGVEPIVDLDTWLDLGGRRRRLPGQCRTLYSA